MNSIRNELYDTSIRFNGQHQRPHSNEDLVEIYEDLPDHHHRIEIPNILEHLDLDPYEYRLYVALKKVAGDSGMCWQSRKTLADRCKMSLDKLNKCLKKLSSVLPIIKCPLISITNRKNEKGEKITNIIKIIPIWRKNGDFFRSSKKDFDERQEVEGSTPGSHKEEPGEEKPSKKNNQKKVSVPVVVPPKEGEGSSENVQAGKEREKKTFSSEAKKIPPEANVPDSTKYFTSQLKEKEYDKSGGQEMKVVVKSKTSKNGRKTMSNQISKDDLFYRIIKEKKDWSKELIDEAWKRFVNNGYPMSNWFNYFTGIINNIESEKKLNQQNRRNECKTRQRNSSRSSAQKRNTRIDGRQELLTCREYNLVHNISEPHYLE